MSKLVSRVALWLLWRAIRREAQVNLNEANAEKVRTKLVESLAKQMLQVKTWTNDDGDQAVGSLYAFVAVVVHSNRLYALARGASVESAMVLPDEHWSACVR